MMLLIRMSLYVPCGEIVFSGTFFGVTGPEPAGDRLNVMLFQFPTVI